MITVEDIHRIVAQKLDLKEDLVEEVNRFQWEFLKDVIEEEKGSIGILHIGKWVKKEPRNFDEIKERLRRLGKLDS